MYTVSQNHGQSTRMANTLRTIPDPVFGQHENCGYWCHDSVEGFRAHKIVLIDPELHSKLTEIFSK